MKELLNVASSNKWLNPAASLVFSKKHGQKRIVMDDLDVGTSSNIFLSYNQIFIQGLKTVFQFLRCFGRCITKMGVDYLVISTAFEFQKSTKRSFSNMGSVCVYRGNLVSDLPKFAECFSKLRHLELCWNENYANATFPQLEHLSIKIINKGTAASSRKEIVAALMRSNHLQSLDVTFHPSVTSNDCLRLSIQIFKKVSIQTWPTFTTGRLTPTIARRMENVRQRTCHHFGTLS